MDNIHLRIASDILLFIQRTQELGTSLLSSIVSLFSFAYILWGISAIAPLPLFGVDVSFPGYLIVVAVAYASLGMVFAHFIGRWLIPLNFMQQRREADFRFAIARVTEAELDLCETPRDRVAHLQVPPHQQRPVAQARQQRLGRLQRPLRLTRVGGAG